MGRKRRKRGLRKQPFKLKLKKETIYSISSTILLVIGGLIILSFTHQGNLLISFNLFLLRLFSWGASLLPFLFISSGFMLTRLRWRLARPNVFVGGVLLFFSSIGLTKAGMVGLQIWAGLAALISGFGAAIILLGSLFVGFIVLFETSLEEIILFSAGLFKFLKQNLGLLFKGKKGEPFIFRQKS